METREIIIALSILGLILMGLGIMFTFERRKVSRAIKVCFGTVTLPLPYSAKKYNQGILVVFKLAKKRTTVAMYIRKGINKNAIYDWCEVEYFKNYRMGLGTDIALLENDWEKLNTFISTSPATIRTCDDTGYLKHNLQTLFDKLDNFQRVKALAGKKKVTTNAQGK